MFPTHFNPNNFLLIIRKILLLFTCTPALSDCPEESKLVRGDSEAIRKFSDEYIVPEKLVAEYTEHLVQITMCKGRYVFSWEGEEEGWGLRGEGHQ